SIRFRKQAQLKRDRPGSSQEPSGRALEELQESEKRYREIVESSGDAIIGTDIDGVVTTWNPGAESIFGYSAPEALGRSIGVLVPPERSGEAAEHFEQIRRGQSVWRYETVRVRRDHQRIDVALSVFPVVAASGRVVGASMVVRDITELKRGEES